MEPLKDQFFSNAYVKALAHDVKALVADFDVSAFEKHVLNRDWKTFELKQRMHHIADTLHTALARDFKSCIAILAPIVQERIKHKTNTFGDMIFPDFVERFGLDDFKTSTKALEIYTAAASSEFAVRPFIVRYPDKMMKVMLGWSKHKSEHVRRLASEGCRPRLPWGMALAEFKKDPKPILKILEKLKNDPSEYVRRSVANNLNDISKDNLEIALSTAERWFGKTAETDALVRHALRNELKKGNSRALKMFALSEKTQARITKLQIVPKAIRIGEHVHMEFELQATKRERLRIEYWVYFVKASGAVSKKVFQVTEREFEAGNKLSFRKKHRFQDFTTRKHYAGAHRIVVAINGVAKSESKIRLRK